MSHTIRCFQDLLPEQGVFYPLSNDISKFCDSKIVFQVLYVDLSLIFFFGTITFNKRHLILDTFFAALIWHYGNDNDETQICNLQQCVLRLEK